MEDPGGLPAKRKRVDSTEMTGPDGFTKAKIVSKPRSRASVPIFQSAFDTGQVHGSNKPKSTTRSKGSLTAFQPSHKAGSSTSELGSSISNPLTEHRTPISKGLPPSKPLHVVKAPQFQKYKSTTSETSSKPFSKMKVLPPPVVTTPPTIVPSIVSSKVLKNLAPPLFPVVDASFLLSSVDHKPIPQFLPIRPSTPPYEKPMKTIGTTRVALVTDISSDGAAELASILLQQHHVEDESDGYQVPESKWGLQVSPQKGKQRVRGHEHGVNKFIRGGLAAQASSVLSHLNTSLALWSKEISMHFSTSSSSSRSYRLPKPDMRLQIVKIIHTPPPNTSSISIPGVAICRREIPSKIAPFPLEVLPQHASHTEFQYLLTLLSFVARPSPPGTAVRNPIHFKDNREIWVWKPWRMMSIEDLGNRSHHFSQVLTIEDDENKRDAEELFASLQDGSITSTKAALEDVAYLCDRFVIPS
ncbi:hypothetical protein E1B28_006128 [Marasmius oreades]|uniref:Uncharacterized protein n=1 Tax=Marasmius oreades TaxID=181124 RepID=A0A9P7S4Z0_9AGAR|nr:uncharacterized protein E1B28_006128 [Marasmius oreades]KAG7095370.1 hypothetical protein E1B28_006128 [Marasmius oreades]